METQAHIPVLPEPVGSPAARIALITETWPPEVNGVAHTLSNLARELIAGGDPVLVIRPRQPGDGSADNLDRRGWQECLIPGLPIPRYPGLRFGLPAIRQLKQNLADFDAQAVYVATQGPLGWAAVTAARQLGLPVVSGFHTNFQQYLGHYGFGLLKQAAWAYLRRFHRRSNLTLVPTEAQGKALTQDGFGPTAMLGRGVDCRLFSPARRDRRLRQAWGVGDKEQVLLHVGRLAPEKNPELAIRAFEAMAPVFPGLKLVFVGDGPLRDSLQAMCPQAHFAGMRTGTDLARHYASADLLLVPSLSETFGNVVLEGMASGLAVCAFNYAAAEQYIRHHKHGFLAPYGDEYSFLDRVEQALIHRSIYGGSGMAARANVLRLEWPTIAARFRQQLLRPGTTVMRGSMREGNAHG
ncbi:glycosyltransferase family 1 protein [Gammaproteobacteria bacterium AB-CW1]|uniref:Glycosyltransferase family 1 protein n=1 Tax=Natronospira elongata TaxID=3110268 RepID=A0AAP6JH59_9GAMM|nr:glycosyltransferase family 1 protein [Gammaproteobacteria bacterium AB-CW1]